MNDGKRTTASDDALTLAICEKAMEWWLDTREPDCDANLHITLQAWRNEDPLHERAWQKALVLGGQLQALRDQGAPTLARDALLTTGEGLSRRRAIKGLALLLVAGSSAWAARDSEMVDQLRADHTTGVNEQRQIVLASDLNVHLNTRSALNAQRVDGRWQLALLSGEMLVNSQVSPALMLSTLQLSAQTSTARFTVRQFGGQPTELAVYAGSLLVMPRHASGSTLLQAGQQARFDSLEQLDQRPLEHASPAWSEGMIVAQGQPLQAFLTDLSRYRRGHLGCDPALADLPVWGTYPLADSERIIEAVAQTLHLDVQRFTRLWVNLRPRVANA